MTGDVTTSPSANWLMGREHIQCEYAGQRDDLHPGWDGVGWCKISSRYSERCAVENLWIVYFWNFPFNMFALLNVGKWNYGRQKQGERELLYMLSSNLINLHSQWFWRLVWIQNCHSFWVMWSLRKAGPSLWSWACQLFPPTPNSHPYHEDCHA